MASPPPAQQSSGGRTWAPLLILGVVALFGLLLWFILRPTPRTRPSADTTAAGSTERAGDGRPRNALTQAASAFPFPVANGAKDDPGLPGPTREEVENFRRFRTESLRTGGRYPGFSRRLTDRHIEALTQVEKQVSRGSGSESEDEQQDALVASATKLQFQDGEPPLINAEVVNLKTRQRQPARFTAQLVRLIDNGRAPPGPIGSIAFRDDGTQGDDVGGDMLHTAAVDPGAYPGDTLLGQVHVEIRATLSDGRERFVVTSFRYGSPKARLTGVFNDHLQEGHLILEAQVEVSQAKRYHLEGGLVAKNGTLVAWAQNAAELQPGTQTMQLKFFGLAFHEAGEHGPYTLKYIVVSETGIRPVLQGDILRDAYVTRPYQLGDFASAPNKDPALDEVLRQSEDIQKFPVVGEGRPRPPVRTRPPPPGHP